MKQASSDQLKRNTEWLIANNIVDVPPIDRKYTITTPFKFGGKKKKSSNSGNVGRAARRKRRAYLGGGPGKVTGH